MMQTRVSLALFVSLVLLLPLTGARCLSPLVSAGGSPPVQTGISAIWANEGGDKVTQDELRAFADPLPVRNSVWDGTTVRLFGARNEVVSFNLRVRDFSLPDLPGARTMLYLGWSKLTCRLCWISDELINHVG